MEKILSNSTLAILEFSWSLAVRGCIKTNLLI